MTWSYETTAPVAVNDNAPLRLKDAVVVAFPMGGMTASGLRKEAKKGRLRMERIAGKDFVTLAAIEEMRTLCRIEPMAPIYISKQRGETKLENSPTSPSGSFEMAAETPSLAALRASLSKLG